MAAQLTLQQSGSALSSVCPCMARAQARGQAARPAEVAKDSYRNLFVTPLPLQILKFLVEDYAEAARNLEEYINEACDEIAYGTLCGDGSDNEEFDDLCEKQDEVVSVLHTHMTCVVALLQTSRAARTAAQGVVWPPKEWYDGTLRKFKWGTARTRPAQE